MSYHQYKNGFTLIEILIVAAIVATISGLTLIGLNTFSRPTKISQARSELGKLALAVELLVQDTGRRPNGCPAIPTSCNPETNLSSNFAGLTNRPQTGYDNTGGSNSCDDIRFTCNWTTQLIDRWRGPYYRGTLRDPWGREYIFDPDYFGFTGNTSNNGCRNIPECSNRCNELNLRDGVAILSLGPDGQNYTCDDIVYYFAAF